ASVGGKARFRVHSKPLRHFHHQKGLMPRLKNVGCSAAGGPEGASNSPESNASPSVDPQLQSAKQMLRIPPSTMYTALAVVSASLSLISLALPEALLGAAFPPSPAGEPAWGALEVLYLRIAGATLMPRTASELCLKDAAANGRLQSATYRRQMLGGVLNALAHTAAFLSVPALWVPLNVLTYLPVCLFNLLVNSLTLWASGKNPQKPAASMALSPLPSSLMGWFYT
ncbi:hypothetical protein DUNSADRAFT_16245, partial [Dunaliella salina]